MTTGINLGRQDINRFYTKYQEKERRSQILFIAVGDILERGHTKRHTLKLRSQECICMFGRRGHDACSTSIIFLPHHGQYFLCQEFLKPGLKDRS